MSEIWQGLIGILARTLTALHDVTEPLFGLFAWGWAIILLTIVVRVLLLPLAIKQTSSMRAMQGLQPELKKIQAKYKADRSLMRTDPEKYREMQQQQREEMSKLYQERGVNPLQSCMPLLLRALPGLLFNFIIYGPALQGPLHQGLHDRVAKTVVIERGHPLHSGGSERLGTPASHSS